MLCTQRSTVPQNTSHIGLAGLVMVTAALNVSAAETNAISGAQQVKAQPMTPPGKTAPAKTLREEAIETQKKLVAIQQETLEQNKSLQKKQAVLEELALKKINAELEGTTFEEERDALAALGEKIRAAGENGTNTSAMIGKYQARAQSLRAAQQSISRDEEVLSAEAEFRDDLLTAMKQENPKTEELLSRMQNLQRQLQMQQQMQRMQQQQQQQPGTP